MKLSPGKWYGVKLSEKRIVPSLEVSKQHPDELTSSTAPRFRPIGMYIGPQWVCQNKSNYSSIAFLPETNERPEDPGPIRYFEFHSFLMADNKFMWINHEHIDRLQELDEESYKERLGCGNPNCQSLPLTGGLTGWGTGIRKLGADENDIIDPCLTCANLHRKALKARGVTHVVVFPKYPFAVHDPTTGL